MRESYPSFYWVVASFVQPIRCVREDLPKDMQMEFVARALNGCEMFLREKGIRDTLPRSTEKVLVFQVELGKWARALAGTRLMTDLGDISILKTILDSFSISFQDELDGLAMFTVTPKGNLDIHRLVSGMSKGYPKSVLESLDDFIKGEVDYAGECLAFELPTACGFHILRAVEIAAKAYVHAATGKLPGIKNRNWGEYILQLTQAGAHSDVTDVLKILKTKRNPLMHPQDSIEMEEAIGLVCICQSAIETLVADIRRRNLEVTFEHSLEILPTL